MQIEPLVVAKMAVSNIGHGVSVPGETEPKTESVQLQVDPRKPVGSVPQGMCQLTITDPARMRKLALGQTYQVILVAVDPGEE